MHLCRLSLVMHSTISGHYFCDDYHFSKLFQSFLYILLKSTCFDFWKIPYLLCQTRKTLNCIGCHSVCYLFSNFWSSFFEGRVRRILDVGGIFPNKCNSLFNLASIEYRKSNWCGSECRIVSTCNINCDRLARSQEHLCESLVSKYCSVALDIRSHFSRASLINQKLVIYCSQCFELSMFTSWSCKYWRCVLK